MNERKDKVSANDIDSQKHLSVLDIMSSQGCDQVESVIPDSVNERPAVRAKIEKCGEHIPGDDRADVFQQEDPEHLRKRDAKTSVKNKVKEEKDIRQRNLMIYDQGNL